MKIGKQDGGGLTTLSKIKSKLNFDNVMSNTFRSRFVPWPCSSQMASFSLVYNQAA
jgi:predicted NUDIX family NTP pyrophosphohydrolase